MLKIIKWEEIGRYKKYWQNKKTVLVGGCFDIFHYGHLKFLQQAKKQAERLIVCLESDLFIKKNKKRPPIHNQKQRAEILASISFVDFVIMLPYFSSDKDYYNLVEMVRPSLIAVTEGDRQLENKKKQGKMIGIVVKTVSRLLKNFSSTKIINILKSSREI